MKHLPIVIAALALAPALAAGQGTYGGTAQSQATTASSQDSTGTKASKAKHHRKRHRKHRHSTTSMGSMSQGSMNNSSSSAAAAGQQSQSGVTDTRTGASTLGRGVSKTRPDQGTPVTSKGDTLRRGGDSVAGRRPPR